MRMLTTVLVLVALSTAGCANRRWGPCALAGGLIGGAIGGVGAGVGVNELEPDPTHEEIFGGAGAGLATGMLIGTLLGHAICDPEEEEIPMAVPPPPPPPPPPAKKGTMP